MAKGDAIVVAETELRMDKFSDNEMKRWNDSWDELKKFLNNQVYAPILTPKDQAIALQMAQVYKHLNDGKEFQGLKPKNGFGMRFPLLVDLTGNANSGSTTEWDVNWGTAGFREWLADDTPDAGADSASSNVQLYDSAQDKWAFVQFGFASWHPSPKIKQVVTTLNRNGHSIENIEFHMRMSEMQYYRQQKPLWVPHNIPHKNGIEIRTTGYDVLVPVGLIFATHSRFKDQTLSYATAV
jgi:hypothetical protein